MVKHWTPSPLWEGQPCYIVGGGPSLRDFPFDTISGEFVLGCNVAFHLGVDTVPITIFGDASFLPKHREGLDRYIEDGGVVVTNSSRLKKSIPPWLRMMKKQLKGMGTGDTLGWNGNTGASAINLALLLGADPIYLLGYDMAPDPVSGKANYHEHYRQHPIHRAVYPRFLKGMHQLALALPVLFPGRTIINLEDGTSHLEVFPKESLAAHMKLTEVAA